MGQPVEIKLQLTGGQATADGVQRVGQALAEMAKSGTAALDQMAAKTREFAVRASGDHQTSAERAARAAAEATKQSADQSASAVEASATRIKNAYADIEAAVKARLAGLGGTRSSTAGVSLKRLIPDQAADAGLNLPGAGLPVAQVEAC